jgi:glucose/arabinose dehydrogenase
VEEVDHFDEPWAMAFLPGSGDLLVTERSGTLHLRDADSGERVEVEGTPAVVPGARRYSRTATKATAIAAEESTAAK